MRVSEIPALFKYPHDLYLFGNVSFGLNDMLHGYVAFIKIIRYHFFDVKRNYFSYLLNNIPCFVIYSYSYALLLVKARIFQTKTFKNPPDYIEGTFLKYEYIKN